MNPETQAGTKFETAPNHGVGSNDGQRPGRYAGRQPGDLSGLAAGATAVVESGVAAVREGKNAFAAAKDQSKRAAAFVRDGARDHPAMAVGIAVGVGVVLGLAGSAMVRPRK